MFCERSSPAQELGIVQDPFSLGTRKSRAPCLAVQLCLHPKAQNFEFHAQTLDVGTRCILFCYISAAASLSGFQKKC